MYRVCNKTDRNANANLSMASQTSQRWRHYDVTHRRHVRARRKFLPVFLREIFMDVRSWDKKQSATFWVWCGSDLIFFADTCHYLYHQRDLSTLAPMVLYGCITVLFKCSLNCHDFTVVAGDRWGNLGHACRATGYSKQSLANKHAIWATTWLCPCEKPLTQYNYNTSSSAHTQHFQM